MTCFMLKTILRTLLLLIVAVAMLSATPINAQVPKFSDVDRDNPSQTDARADEGWLLTVASEINHNGDVQTVDAYLISGNGEVIPGARRYVGAERVRLSAERPAAIVNIDCSLQWWWYEPTYDAYWHSVPQSNQHPEPVIDKDKWFKAVWTCDARPPMPPSAPTLNAIANPASGDEYAVTWSSVANADSYQLQENRNNSVWSTVYNGADRTYTVTAQEEGNYCYRVRATNAVGSSGWSSSQCTTVDPATLPPSMPVLNAIVNPGTDDHYTVTWSSAANAEGYQLQENRNGGPWSTVYNGANLSYDAAGMEDGDYCYRLRASNSGGESIWGSTNCTTVDTRPSAPAVPSLDGVANSDGDGNYTVSWSESQNAITYQTQERKNSGTWTTVYSGRHQSFDAVARSAGDYCYRVQARNTLGESGWSSTRCTTVLLPATPDCYQLTLSHTGSGTDPVASPVRSDGCDAGSYLANEPISLIATPADGWQLDSWSGTDDNSSSDSTNTLVMPANPTTVSVIYTPNCYRLVIVHTGDGSDPEAAPPHSNGCATGSYHAGETIVLTATPTLFWGVDQWSGTENDVSTSRQNSVVMPAADHTVSVVFQRTRDPIYLPIAY